jgi:catechol 2,3-dioxygenase-like lactoylglutathione lyase family enzyme
VDVEPTTREAVVVDLVPFILVADVERSISFYETLGFEVIKHYEPDDRLEFAGLESTSSAKLMLARVDDVPETGPDASPPGFLYLYTSDLEGLRALLLETGHDVDEIEDGPGPGPTRQMCVRDPDGHGHMVAELFADSVGRDPAAACNLGEPDQRRQACGADVVRQELAAATSGPTLHTAGGP